MSDEKASSKYKSRRSRILYLITTLIIVVFSAYGLVTWFMFRGSQDRLIEKSKEKLIETEAENINSAASYIVKLLLPIFDATNSNMSAEEIAMSIMNRKIMEGQRVLSEEINKMMKAGLLGLEEILYVELPTTFITEPLVMLSSDESLIYTWEVPEYLLEATNEGTSYLYTEEGFPELGLQGKYLITITFLEWEGSDNSALYTIKNMEDEVAVLDDFFSNEQKNINLVLGFVIPGSILFIILIIFFVLSYLIRKRITEPVDELASVADQVNQGNLEVDITIHEGGEFEGLERAFKEMVEGFRRIIDKSVGEE